MISRVIISLLLLQFVEAHQKLEDLDEGVADPDDPVAKAEASPEEPQAANMEMPEGTSMTLSEKFKWFISQPKEYYLEHHKFELTGLLLFVVAIAHWYRGKE